MGGVSSWCFDRMIGLYQQRIQWLSEDSRKVTRGFQAWPSRPSPLPAEASQVPFVDFPLECLQLQKKCLPHTNTTTQLGPGSNHAPFVVSEGFILRKAVPRFGEMLTKWSEEQTGLTFLPSAPSALGLTLTGPGRHPSPGAEIPQLARTGTSAHSWGKPGDGRAGEGVTPKLHGLVSDIWSLRSSLRSSGGGEGSVGGKC